MKTVEYPKPVEWLVTCESCPWQVEGRLEDGRVFYFRHRHCRAGLGFGTDLNDAIGNMVSMDYCENNEDCGKPPGYRFCSGLEGEEIAYVWQRLCDLIAEAA